MTSSSSERFSDSPKAALARGSALAALMAAVLAGCAAEEGGPPPVFNAIDPSLQCPAGKVGWDFTTGGNETDVIPVRVGSEIKIDEVVLRCADATTAEQNLTASFRADCDNSVKCERKLLKAGESLALTCMRRHLVFKYRCGNEPTVYNLSRLNVDPLSYSGQELINPQPVNDGSETMLVSCTDTIQIKGASSNSGGTWSNIYTPRLTQCNGLRRCFSNQKTHMVEAGGGRIAEKLKVYYTCGTNTAVREAQGEYRFQDKTSVPIDFSCANDVERPGFERNATIYYKSLTFVPGQPQYYKDKGEIERLSNRLKSACEGQRNCSIPIKRSDLPEAYGSFSIEYWCGSSRGITEAKHHHTLDFEGRREWRGLDTIDLQCGGRLRIVGADQAWVKTACPDGARVCSVPPGEPETRINFFCEGNAGTFESSKRILRNESQNANFISPRSVECPLESERTGIDLLQLVDGQYTRTPNVEDASACNNRNSCLIRPFGNYKYKYRCSGTDEVKMATSHTVDGQKMEYLDCRPTPKVTEISGCFTAPTAALACKQVPSAGCTVSLAAAAAPATIRTCSSDITIKYKCGSDQTVLSRAVPSATFAQAVSPDGGAYDADGGALFDQTVECPYDPTPRATPSNKACIPTTCPNKTKRNAAMECERDENIVVYPDIALAPNFVDPGTLKAVTELKEGFPYIKSALVTYPSKPALTQDQAGTIWAYDVFKKKNGMGGEFVGFRCIVSTPTLNWNNGIYAVLGDWQVSESSVLPTNCFNAAYGDLNSSWYHGSRQAGVNEQVFRNDYQILRTEVAVAFDPKGRVVASYRNAPNPVGFFYTPATGYVDQTAYFAQQTDFRFRRVFKFAPTTQIELETGTSKLDQAVIEVGPNSLDTPPALDLNFGWRMLGDSPFHPHSPDSRIRTPDGTSLAHRRLRGTIEIAKETSTLANKWQADNMAVVGAINIAGGNAQEKVERLTLRLPVDVVKRMVTVRGTGAKQRPDGWMQNNIEVNSVFKVRVCLDFNGIERAPGDTGIDNRFVSLSLGGTTYKLGVTRRCTAELPLALVRDLFPKPVLPVNAVERGIDKGSTLGQGGGRVSSATDQASQQGCRKQCTVSSDCGAGGLCEKPANAIGYCAQTTENVECGSSFRAGSTSGGSVGFGRSLFSAQSRGQTHSQKRTPTASNSANVELMGFNILSSMDELAGQVEVGSTKSVVRLSLGRTWASVAAVGEAIKKLTQQANPKPVKPWWKPGFSRPFGGKDPQPGLAFGISVGGPIFAGIVVLHGEFSLSVALGFDIVLKFVTDQQNASNMNNPSYPCLGTTKCLKLSTEAKTFIEANEDCSVKGGRLAEARDANALTALKSAAAGNEVWLGAQAAYLFDDPTCGALSGTAPVPGLTAANVQARLDECKASSVAQYQWINGNSKFADSQSNGTLFNVSSTNQGFGSITTIANSANPLKTGLLLKTNGSVEAHRASNKAGTIGVGPAPRTAKYVCEFDPAARYTMNEVSLTPGVEFSAGVGAAVCFPSSVIGACLTAEFKFFTAGVGIEMANRSTKIYDSMTATQPRATIGESGTSAKWEIAFLTGGIGVEIRFFFGSKNHNIVSYSGVGRWEDTLWSDVDRFRR